MSETQSVEATATVATIVDDSRYVRRDVLLPWLESQYGKSIDISGRHGYTVLRLFPDGSEFEGQVFRPASALHHQRIAFNIATYAERHLEIAKTVLKGFYVAGATERGAPWDLHLGSVPPRFTYLDRSGVNEPLLARWVGELLVREQFPVAAYLFDVDDITIDLDKLALHLTNLHRLPGVAHTLAELRKPQPNKVSELRLWLQMIVFLRQRRLASAKEEADKFQPFGVLAHAQRTDVMRG